VSNNPLTTARINRIVYDLRHWKITLVVGTVFLVTRFVVGRDLRGGRKTDATFFRRARLVRGRWWASAPGWQRAGIRFAALGGVWLWFTHPVVVVVLAVLGAAGAGWRGMRAWRTRRHEKRVLEPLWGAVAGIIGVPADEPPRAWLNIPKDMNAPGAPITVGLLAADSKDDQRVNHLLILFSQRFGREFVADVDYARRLVHLHYRPEEPAIWTPVARILGVDPGELADDWLTMPAAIEADTAAIVVSLPDHVVDDEPLADNLETLVNQRFRGRWAAHPDRARRQIVMRRKRPIPEPPTRVDFLAELPDADWQPALPE
jgi:hypothetical protein